MCAADQSVSLWTPVGDQHGVDAENVRLECPYRVGDEPERDLNRLARDTGPVTRQMPIVLRLADVELRAHSPACRLAGRADVGARARESGDRAAAVTTTADHGTFITRLNRTGLR
jgi:hypothetical protein